jgi:cytoskeleton protein RodZ
VTSEDPTNVHPAPAEKPRRGRKPKNAAATSATASPTVGTTASANLEATPVATSLAQAAQAALVETVPVELTSPTDTTNEPVVDAPEEYGAAMGLESIPEQPASPSMTYGSGCGNVLKAARETQGLSIHEVSGQLRLGVKQIQAIEQDDFDKLPQPSIVRGFIRNYARLLKIDVAPILEAYQRIVPDKAPLPLSVRSNASRSVIDKPARTLRPQRLLTLLIFLILAAIAAYFYINHIKPHTLKDASLALDVAEISETTGQQIEIPPPQAAPTTAPAGTSTDSVTAVDAANSANPAVTEAPAEGSASQQPAAGMAPPTTADSVVSTPTIVSTPTPAAGQAVETTTLKAVDPQKANLFFKVTEDSWVRIEDMQGKKLFSEVLPAGSERQVVTDKPVNITVGHAAGTQLTIDNQPYDLTQATRGRVARIQLK